MSYQTAHYLEMPDEGPDMSEVSAMLTEIASGKSPGDPVHGMYQNTWRLTLEGEPTRWYDSTEHMTKVSKRWPDVLFTLRGEGEDANDRWVAYYKNGQEQLERQPEWNPAPPHPDLGLIQPELAAAT